MPNSKARFAILNIIILIMICAIGYRLYDLQIVKGEMYMEVAEERLTSNIVKKAPRGEIFDRYGEAFVSNKVAYDLVLQRAGQSNEELNNTIKKVLEILDAEGIEVEDTLPISYAPYYFTFEENDTTEKEWFENNTYIDDEILYGMSANEVMEAYKEIYQIPNTYTQTEIRRIVGIRYEAQLRGFSQVSPYCIAQNLTPEAVAKIKEMGQTLKGVSVSNTYVREYNKPDRKSTRLNSSHR